MLFVVEAAGRVDQDHIVVFWPQRFEPRQRPLLQGRRLGLAPQSWRPFFPPQTLSWSTRGPRETCLLRLP